MKTSLQTPVVFLIYNRPETTQQVFAAIRSARPARLLVVADGPRPDHPGDAEDVAAARHIIAGVDWPCEVLTCYAETNLGCRKRASSGLDWAFSIVPEAIVLEDDCVPHPSFFGFCEQLLARYRTDSRIMAISGICLHTPSASPYSYTFSRKSGFWGWASWRRAWQHFDVAMPTWPTFREAGGVRACVDTPAEAAFYETTFESTFRGLNDSWGWAWYYACLSQHGLTIRPTVNLIRNVGFGPKATHTTQPDVPYAHLPLEQIGPLKHPPVVLHDKHGDRVLFEQLHAGLWDGYREPQAPAHRATAPSESASPQGSPPTWRERYLEQRLIELRAALRAKADVIQRLVRGHEHAALRARVEQCEQTIMDQQEQLRAKEAVIQRLVRARASTPAAQARRSSRLLDLARHLARRTKRLWPSANGDDGAASPEGGIEENAPPRAPMPDALRAAPRIILGAADSAYPGWYATDRALLDVTRRAHFKAHWAPNTREAFLAEHLWEHLDDRDADAALRNCYAFLKPGGRLRIAVPDAFHPDPGYQQWVRPGGIGPGAADHRAHYDYRTLSHKLHAAGFQAILLEYWDEHGRFHFHPWSWAAGPIRRSSQHDSRNLAWPNTYTSLIIDGIKPVQDTAR